MNKRLFLLIAIIVTVSSCAVRQIRPAPTLTQMPAVERLPLVIGLYQSQSFKQYTEIRREQYKHFYEKFEIGSPSSELLSSVLKVMFKQVIPVDDMNNIPKDVAALLKPDIVGFSLPAVLKIGTELEIIYQFALFDNKRKAIGILRVTGKSKINSWRITLDNLTEFAMKDAMAQFMVAFREESKFKRWLAEKGITDNKIEVSQ